MRQVESTSVYKDIFVILKQEFSVIRTVVTPSIVGE